MRLYNRRLIPEMDIVNRGTIHNIPKEWIPRWELLSNFKSDNEGVPMPLDWDPEELKEWITWNDSIMRFPPNIASLLSVRKLIDFMLPTRDDYLLYVKNDLEDREQRVKMYDRLGRHIASLDYVPGCIVDQRFFEYAERMQELMNVGENLHAQRDKILRIPYMVLLGIIANARESNLLSIDWGDLKDTLFSKESVATYEQLLTTTWQGDVSSILSIWADLPNVTTSEDLRLLSGTPLEHPINRHYYYHVRRRYSEAIIESDVCAGNSRLTALYNREYSAEDVNKLIQLIEIQVKTVPVECIAGIIKYMLCLGPIIDYNPGYGNLRQCILPISCLILKHMAHRLDNHETKWYRSVCESLASIMGTKYLSICCEAIVRLLKYHHTIEDPDKLGEESVSWLVSTVDSDVYSFKKLMKKEDERLLAFSVAITDIIGGEANLTGFRSWIAHRS